MSYAGLVGPFDQSKLGSLYAASSKYSLSGLTRVNIASDDHA